MAGPAVERVVIVQAAQQGSGYLISPRLVVTAAHVARDRAAGQTIRVIAPGFGAALCDLVWSGDEDDDCDVALLRTREELLSATRTSVFERMDWGEIGSADSLPDCQVIGYPAGAERNEQLLGTVSAESSSRLLFHRFASPAPAAQDPWWIGLSGAPVFVEDVFVGIVTARPRGRQDTLAIVPAAWILRRSAFGVELDRQPRLVQISADTSFERRYAEYVVQRHSLLTIYGLTVAAERRWPLEAAYLNLHVAEQAGAGASQETAVSITVEEALSQHARVLLRGGAGSGKTTLLQWFAVSAARQGLTEGGPSRGMRIPFLLPLRSLPRDGAPLPGPEEFLTATGAPLAGLEPRGWVGRVLAAGRGLLLIDGLDELPPPDRQRVERWLSDLLLAFPANQWVVTSRPAGLTEAWPTTLGFTEFALLPMSDSDVDGFIARWHEAAQAAAPQGGEELRALETSLLHAVHDRPHLRQLATSPLMCTLICALHRDRRGYLPHGEMELYAAALDMLLERRDRERAIDSAHELRAEQQLQLLSRFAYWLVRNGLTEAELAKLVRIVQEALPTTGWRSTTDDPEQVARYLLARSGVLREQAVGAVSFIHRVFQDYLAARQAVEDDDFGFLVSNAHHDTYEQLIRFAVAHARPRERNGLLTRLLSRADEEPRFAARLTLLALSCLEYAQELDPRIRQDVTERASRLLPPHTDADVDVDVELLARAGSAVLDLLPSASDVSRQQAAVLTTLVRRIGGPRSEPLARTFAARAVPPVRASTARPPAPLPLTPGARDLAVALSLASRIEPELMRAVRLHVLPHLDVGAESDLWFSGWVASRTPTAIALRPDVLPDLRNELAGKLAAAERDDPLNALWEVTSSVHADLSPALALEERVTWIHLSGGRGLGGSVDHALQPALRALVDDRRDGIADWLTGAWQRLPEPVRHTTTAWQLAAATLPRVPASAMETPTPPDGLRIDDVAVVAAALTDIPLTVAFQGNDLVLGSGLGPGAAAVPVPDTHPRLVEVIMDGLPHPSVHTVSVDDGDAVTVPTGGTGIRLRTARGITYEFRSALAPGGRGPTGAPPASPAEAGSVTVAIAGSDAQVLPAEAARSAQDIHAAPGTANLPGSGQGLLVGRERDLAALDRLLTADHDAAGLSRAAAIHGLGGIGKSTLALHYAHAHRSAYQLVWWIDAASSDQIITSLAALATRLYPQWATTATLAEQTAWAIVWLQGHRDWLLIFDDVEDPAALRYYLSALPNGHHLATSRVATGWHTLASTLHLRPLEHEPAVALLCALALGERREPTPEQRADAEALAAELSGLPLALEQAGAFIHETGTTLADYRRQLGLHADRAVAATDPARTIARVWHPTFTVLEERSPVALRLLDAMAWLAPDEIPRTLLAPLAPDQLASGEALGTLHAYDLISFSGDRSTLSVHRLMQTVLRLRTAGQADEYPPGRQDAEHLIQQAVRHTDATSWKLLLPHVISVAETTPAQSPASAATARAYDETARHLQRQGSGAHTVLLLEAALDLNERVWGLTHPETLTSRINLASAYTASGEYGRAINLYEAAVALCEETLGAAHPQTLASREGLAQAQLAARATSQDS